METTMLDTEQEVVHWSGITYGELGPKVSLIVGGGALLARQIESAMRRIEPNCGGFVGPLHTKNSARLGASRVGTIARKVWPLNPRKTKIGRSYPSHASDYVMVTQETLFELLGVNMEEYYVVTGQPFEPGWFIRITRLPVTD